MMRASPPPIIGAVKATQLGSVDWAIVLTVSMKGWVKLPALGHVQVLPAVLCMADCRVEGKPVELQGRQAACAPLDTPHVFVVYEIHMQPASEVHAPWAMFPTQGEAGVGCTVVFWQEAGAHPQPAVVHVSLDLKSTQLSVHIEHVIASVGLVPTLQFIVASHVIAAVEHLAAVKER